MRMPHVFMVRFAVRVLSGGGVRGGWVLGFAAAGLVEVFAESLPFGSCGVEVGFCSFGVGTEAVHVSSSAASRTCVAAWNSSRSRWESVHQDHDRARRGGPVAKVVAMRSRCPVGVAHRRIVAATSSSGGRDDGVCGVKRGCRHRERRLTDDRNPEC